MAKDLIDLHLDEAALGPCMRALNERQRRFVIAMLEMPSADHTNAARLAGYSDPGNSGIRAQATRLAHAPKIQAAIQEEARKRMGALQILAISRVGEIAADPLHKDSLKANLALLDRGGLHAKTESHSVIEHRGAPDEEVVEKIIRMAKLLGISPKEALGRYRAPLIDVTPSSEGLEDIL